MSDAVTVPRGAVSQIKARLMSYLFGACQPDHGSVFGWFDDHADEALEFALRDALAASTPVGGCGHTPGYRNGPHKTCSLCGQTHWSPEMPSSAPPPPSVSTGSRPQEAVPTEQTVPAVVAMYVPMPLDADGNGPAGPDDIVRVEHQVWDAETCGTLCTAPDEGVARWIVSLINTTPQPADGCSSNEGADGWIEHDGGPNPVPGQRVDVRWRDGEVSTDEPSRDWCWKPTDGDDTIIAYRIAGSAHD